MKQKYLPLLALYQISEGQPKAVHVEDIAIKSKEISPRSFTWSKYKEHIDLRQVMRTLGDLHKEKLISGSNTKSWTLTSKGITYIEENNLTNLINVQRIIRSPIYKYDLERICNSEAFNKWTSSKELDLPLIKKLFRIDQYTNPTQIETSISKMEQAAMNEDILEDFITEAVKILRNKLRI